MNRQDNETTKNDNRLTMKLIFSSLLFCLSYVAFGQVVITVDANSTCFDSKTYNSSKYKTSIDSAFIIASAVFNSKEFQSFYDTVSFPYWNHCKPNKCKPYKNYRGQDVTTGKEIYERLFKNKEVVWKIYFEKKSSSALGSTCPNTGYTTAYYENIKADMPKLPLAYAIAVNLCHEYMHQLGFCHYSNSFNEPDKEHPDPIGYKNDIAYRVGWDVYDLLIRWHEKGVKIDNL